MKEDAKIEAAYRLLRELGCRGPSLAETALRWVGIGFVPFMFCDYWRLALTIGGWAAFWWGLVLCAHPVLGIGPFHPSLPIQQAILLALVLAAAAGVIFGLVMAWFMRRAADNCQLPLWKDFRPEDYEKITGSMMFREAKNRQALRWWSR